jgi:hypothetical protein
VHIAPTCARSAEGSDHFGSYVPHDLMVTRQQLYCCARVPLPNSIISMKLNSLSEKVTMFTNILGSLNLVGLSVNDLLRISHLLLLDLYKRVVLLSITTWYVL